MKNVFGVLCEKGKEEQRYDGERFVVRKADESFMDKLGSFALEVLYVDAKAGLPPVLEVIKWLGCIPFLLVFAAVVKGYGDVSLAQMFKNAPVLFYVAGVGAVVWLVLFVFEKIRHKKVDNTGAIDEINNKASDIELQCEEELGIPHDAPKVDIFSFEYKEKNGKYKVKAGLGVVFSNNQMRLFKEADNLCLANCTDVYAFSIDGFKKFVHKKQRAYFDEWNKKVDYRKGEYKQYKIRINYFDAYFCKYYALQYTDVFGEYEIFFPEYELKHFEQILNLPVEEE